MADSPVSTSSVHSFGAGRRRPPSPISTGIQMYRESHCVRGFQISPMKITLVALDPTTFKSIVDCDPYVFVSGGAMSLNSDQGPSRLRAVAYLLGLGFHPVRAEPSA